jgi:hypothetical protein
MPHFLKTRTAIRLNNKNSQQNLLIIIVKKKINYMVGPECLQKVLFSKYNFSKHKTSAPAYKKLKREEHGLSNQRTIAAEGIVQSKRKRPLHASQDPRTQAVDGGQAALSTTVAHQGAALTVIWQRPIEGRHKHAVRPPPNAR